VGLDLLLASTTPSPEPASGGFDLLGTILWPLKWLVEMVLVAWHWLLTAVGMPAAITRFTALHCYDNVPEHQLPAELRDKNPGGVARLVDGAWRTDDLAHETTR